MGDMGELGADERKMHKEVGKHAAEKEIDLLLCVGKLSEDMAEAAKAVNSRTQVKHFENKEALMKALPELLEKEDTVLVKASHFMEFGEIVEKLK